MYYNKDILDREGLPYPKAGWTWDDLVATARKCTRGDQHGLSVTQWLQALAPWIWQNGGEFMDAGMTRCTLDQPEAVGAVAFVARLMKEGLAARDADYESQLKQGLFQAGKVALYGPVGYWEVYRFKNITKFRWEVCPLPRGKREATSIALRSYVGLRYTKYPDLTYAFIRKLAGEKMQRVLARIGNGVPGLKRAALTEDFLKPHVPPENEQVFLEVLRHARFMPVLANWREIESVVQEDLDRCLKLGTLDADEACKRIAEKANRLLERERQERDRPRVPLGWLWTFVLLPIALILWIWRHARAREARAGYAFIGLWAAGLLVFTLGPMIVSLVLSFTIWTPIRPIQDVRWAGGENYARLASDANFWKSLFVTTEYAVLSVPLSIALALLLALLVRNRFVAFRTILYMPVIGSAVAIGIIWRGLLGRSWDQTETWIIPGFVLMSLWNVGGPMLVFLAGLQGIDPTLYEAARLDGASKWRQFLHVTLPQLTPVLLFNLIIGAINAFQTFAQPFVMTQGGPGNASLFLVLYLYRNAFKFHHMGYAAALGWVLFAILFLLTLLLLRSSRRWVHVEAS
jgi:multiple sugar transport system permease protein